MNRKSFIILGSGTPMLSKALAQKLPDSSLISIKEYQDMEEKIKSPKELKIKAVEQAEQIQVAEDNDDGGEAKKWKTTGFLTSGLIPSTKKQLKARAANKRGRKARKINRK